MNGSLAIYKIYLVNTKFYICIYPVYWFSVAAVTIYHKLSGLIQ